MKKESGIKWKVGLFSILALVLLLAALYFIGTQKNLFGSVFRIQSLFSNVGGLKIGSNVRFGGITVGSVDDILLMNDTSVKVIMVLKNNVKKFIKTDARASIGSDGLMGDKVMVISPGNSGRTEIRDGETIASTAPVEMESILISLKVSADHAAVITDQLSQLTYRINHGKGALSKLIGDTTFAQNIGATMSNLKKSSQGLSENMEAAKHNFLLKGYFKKKKKEEEKKKKELENEHQKEEKKQD